MEVLAPLDTKMSLVQIEESNLNSIIILEDSNITIIMDLKNLEDSEIQSLQEISGETLEVALGMVLVLNSMIVVLEDGLTSNKDLEGSKEIIEDIMEEEEILHLKMIMTIPDIQYLAITLFCA